MEHRNTMDVTPDQRPPMSARAASVNSLDLLSEAPSIPRVKARDMARSMSDAATKDNLKKQKLATETELSSSWLYQNMRDTINARFKSPRKSPSVHKSELEQSIRQDPELKPIQMKSKAAKTSTCICHFATMIAISLCTIGFLASIAAIIYMEVFAGRNMTFLHSDETEFDLSEVALDSVEAYNLTPHNTDEEHILNEARTHILDGDEEILNEVLKVSTTNDLPIVLNKNSKIKFQDDVTTIYEMEPKASPEDEVVDSSDIHGFKGRSFGIDFNESDEDVSEANTEKYFENFDRGNLQENENNSESEGAHLKNSELLEDTEVEVSKSLNFVLKDDSGKVVSEDNFELKGLSGDNLVKNESNESPPSESFNASEILQYQDFEFEKGPNPATNDVFKGDDKIDLYNKLEMYNSSGTEIPENAFAVLSNSSKPHSVNENEDEIFQSVLEVDPITEDEISQSVDDNTIKNKYDVNTMLITIDDTEVSTDSFISKENDESNVFQVSSPTPSIEPIKQTNVNTVILPKKSVDIKVSLAEAMKHLQNLDVNGKVLTSRTKSKSKVNVQKPKRKTNSNKDEERKKYLQRMRLMLFKQMQ